MSPHKGNNAKRQTKYK